MKKARDLFVIVLVIFVFAVIVWAIGTVKQSDDGAYVSDRAPAAIATSAASSEALKVWRRENTRARDQQAREASFRGMSEGDQALMVFCSGMMLEQIGKNRVPPGEIADASITNLSQKADISLGQARRRLRGLSKTYDGWTGVMNECIDRGWFINPKSIR